VKRHRWSRRVWVTGEIGYIRYCLREIGNQRYCILRRYETKAGTVTGYLPINRGIERGMLSKRPRCRA
jgi:hypothetical protein